MLWSKSSVRSVRYGRALNTTHCNMLPRLSDDHPVLPSSQMQQILNSNPTQRFPAICWDLPIHSAGSGATDCWYPRLHQSHVILSVWKSNLGWFSTTASHDIPCVNAKLGQFFRTWFLPLITRQFLSLRVQPRNMVIIHVGKRNSSWCGRFPIFKKTFFWKSRRPMRTSWNERSPTTHFKNWSKI